MTEIATEIVRICRHFGVFERETVCCGSITVPQCLTLQQLLEGDHAMTELATQAGASLSAMTRLVDGLERRSFVERHRSKEDRRRVVVGLTERGRREAMQLRDQTSTLLATVLSRIPPSKHRQVAEALALLRRAMDEARAEGMPGCCS